MKNNIDPSKMTSPEYGAALLKQRQQDIADYQEQIQSDRKRDNWWRIFGGIDTLLKDRASRNINERVNSSDPIIAREKAEIKKYNEEYNAQKGWRDSIDGIGLEGYAQQEADKFLKAGKYSNIADDLAGLQAINDDLYKKFVADRNLVAKYKLQQYKANKISKGINEEEYLKNLMDWRRGPKDAGAIHELAKIFGIRKDKAEMALEYLLDPNGVKYSEELIANKVGLEKLLTAKDENGDLIWNKEEQERLREALVGFGDIAALRKIDETEKLQNVYNAFNAPMTSVIKSVTEKTPYGTRQNVVYTNNDGSYQNIVNGIVVPKTKAEIAKAAQIVLGGISSDLAIAAKASGKEVTREQIFDVFKKDNYDLYVKTYAVAPDLFPKGYTIPTLSDDDKLMAEGAMVDLTTEKLGTSDTGFFKSFKETWIDPEPDQLDTNQTILYDNFLSGVAESTKYYMRLGYDSEKASKIAYVEQIQGWERTKGSGFRSEDVWNYKRQAAGTLKRGPTSTSEKVTTTTTLNNSPVSASDGSSTVFNTGTVEKRKSTVENLKNNSQFMEVYRSVDFKTKNRMLDSAAANSNDKVRVSMEDFVEVGESERLLDETKGYISWTGTQFEQLGVAAVFTGIVGGKQRQMTFDDVPEGPIKDLIREKATNMYTIYASNVEVDVSDPDKLFKGSFHQEYGFIPAVVERWLGGSTGDTRAKTWNQPKLKVDNLVDIAGYSFLGITQGDSPLARQFLIDAMKDAMPTEEDRLIAAKRILPIKT